MHSFPWEYSGRGSFSSFLPSNINKHIPLCVMNNWCVMSKAFCPPKSIKSDGAISTLYSPFLTSSKISLWITEWIDRFGSVWLLYMCAIWLETSWWELSFSDWFCFLGNCFGRCVDLFCTKVANRVPSAFGPLLYVFEVPVSRRFERCWEPVLLWWSLVLLCAFVCWIFGFPRITFL